MLACNVEWLGVLLNACEKCCFQMLPSSSSRTSLQAQVRVQGCRKLGAYSHCLAIVKLDGQADVTICHEKSKSTMPCMRLASSSISSSSSTSFSAGTRHFSYPDMRCRSRKRVDNGLDLVRLHPKMRKKGMSLKLRRQEVSHVVMRVQSTGSNTAIWGSSLKTLRRD